MGALGVIDDLPLRQILSGPTLLDALRAGARVRADAAVGGQRAAERLLEGFADGDPLARLLLLGALAQTGHPEADAVLCSALEGPDRAEREHAAWALGDRGPLTEAGAGLQALRSQGGFGAMLAELTLDRWSEPRLPPPRVRPAPRRPGLRIVQIYLPGYLDAGLQRAGAGDGGGLATLLVHLSAALAADPAVAQVTTLTRAFGGPGVPAVHATLREPVSARAAIERIRFGGDGYLGAPDLWPHRRELERELEAALTRLAPIDAVHLRFADVATLAAERVCRRLGLPVYFTLAPDPHAVIRGREASGELDRRSFVQADLAEHLIFRARLVEHMRDRCPRPRPAAAGERAGGAADAGRAAREPRTATGAHRARRDLDRPGRPGRWRARRAGSGRPRPGTPARSSRPALDPLRRPAQSGQGLPGAGRRLGGRPRAARGLQPGHRRRRPRAPDAARATRAGRSCRSPRAGTPAPPAACCSSDTAHTATCSP